MKVGKTSRGFQIANFKDRNGVVCSIQESSLATERCIWLGCDSADLKVLAFQINGGTPDGWVPLPLPNGVTENDVSCNTRMHLNRKQAKALIPLLQAFVKTGRLK